MKTAFLEKILHTMSILYIDYNETYRINVTKALKMKSSKIFVAKTAQEALELYKNHNIDIILTDINLQKQNDGIELIKTIRQENLTIPIIVISASKDAMQIVQLIGLKLIDYIFKPISLKRLRDDLYLAVQTILDNGKFMIFFDNNIVYNVQKQLLLQNKQEIPLTHNERSLLNFLILHQGTIATKDEIKDAVWEYAYDITDSAFKSLINRLRSKIGKQSIKNVSGSGYILNV